MRIRKIKSCDTEHVRKLIDGILDHEFPGTKKAYSYDDLKDPHVHYGGKRDIFLVAEKEGKIIGTVAIKEETPDSAMLRRVFLHKDYRGKGYGEKLLSKAMEFCFEHNYRTVRFRGTDKMQQALQFCLKNGFEREAVTELDDFNLVVLSRKL